MMLLLEDVLLLLLLLLDQQRLILLLLVLIHEGHGVNGGGLDHRRTSTGGSGQVHRMHGCVDICCVLILYYARLMLLCLTGTCGTQQHVHIVEQVDILEVIRVKVTRVIRVVHLGLLKTVFTLKLGVNKPSIFSQSPFFTLL